MATLLNFSLPSSTSPTTFVSSSKTLKLLTSLTKKPSFGLKSRAFAATCSLHSASATTNPPTAQVQTFWQWLCDQKVVSPKSPIRPATVAEGLGLVAQRDIAKNEVVLEVPMKFWINPDMVAVSEIGSLCSGLKPWISVALFLIREKKNEDSPWRVYLDILPECTDSTVFWWVSLCFLFLTFFVGSVLFGCFSFEFLRLIKCSVNGFSAGLKRSLLSFKVSEGAFRNTI